MSFVDRLNLGGHRLLIVGGATPIARETVSFAAKHGLRSVVLVDAPGVDMDESIGAAQEGGVEASAVGVAAGDLDGLVELRIELERHGDPIDLLIGAVDEASRTPFSELDRAEWDRVAVGQAKQLFAACRAFVPAMAERGYGRVVHVASIAGKRGHDGLGGPAYATVHAAINGLTRALAREFADRGVRVNAIDRGLTEGEDGAARSVVLADIPLAREALLSEVAAAAVFLLSDASAYVTGETLNVDGGLAME